MEVDLTPLQKEQLVQILEKPGYYQIERKDGRVSVDRLPAILPWLPTKLMGVGFVFTVTVLLLIITSPVWILGGIVSSIGWVWDKIKNCTYGFTKKTVDGPCRGNSLKDA